MIAVADRQVVTGYLDGALVDVIYLADLNDKGTVNTHELRTWQVFLYCLQCHECHDGALVLNVQSHVVLYALHKKQLAKFHLNQTVFAFDVEKRFLLTIHTSMPQSDLNVQPYVQE